MGPFGRFGRLGEDVLLGMGGGNGSVSGLYVKVSEKGQELKAPFWSVQRVFLYYLPRRR